MSDGKFRQPREPLVVGGMECHAADLTATISFDTTLELAQQRLAEYDQWIPIDGDPRLPVGTLVGSNSSGPLRLGFGAWRDLLLGCQFRLATGELITAGGRTMKNVAGYDLTKFMVGQHGVLGSIVTITTRTYKRPAHAMSAEFEPSDQFLGQIIATPLRPRWAVLTPQSLWCGWLDDEPALALFARLAAVHQPRQVVRRTLQQDIAHRHELWNVHGNRFRASVPPAKIQRFAERAGLTHWSADAVFGVVVGPMSSSEEAILEAAKAEGGSVTFYLEGQPKYQSSPGEAAILESLKAAFGAPAK